MLLGVLFTATAAGQSNPAEPPPPASVAMELELSRRLVDALERENAALKESLATTRAASAVLTELNAARKAETAALREALTAKNETIAAKDAALSAQDKLIAGLRSKKSSIWKRFGDIAIGAAIATAVR